MDKKDMTKLWALLEKYYPNAKQLKDTALKAAWGLAFEPYAYDDVKAAAVVYARGNKYFPDVSDITGLCPATPRPAAAMTPTEQACWDLSQARWEAYKKGLHDAGLPTMCEATDQGMTTAEWNALTAEFHANNDFIL